MTDPNKKRRRWVVYSWLAVYLMGSVGVLYCLSRTPGFTSWAWRQARGTRYESDAIRWHLIHNGEPVEKALAIRTIRDGQSVEEVIATYGPFRVTTAGRYQELEPPGNWVLMFEGYRIVARDGRLVGAAWWTCTGSIEFFNTMAPGEWTECNAALRERRYLEHTTPRMAVAGGLAYIHPSPPPEPEPPDGQPTPPDE